MEITALAPGVYSAQQSGVVIILKIQGDALVGEYESLKFKCRQHVKHRPNRRNYLSDYIEVIRPRPNDHIGGSKWSLQIGSHETPPHFYSLESAIKSAVLAVDEQLQINPRKEDLEKGIETRTLNILVNTPQRQLP